MSELATYSIETDHTVLLAFKDGRKLRVPIGQLSHHLAPPDLAKVRAAIKLRRDFIRRHMPKVALLVAATGLVGLLSVGGQVVARLISPPDVDSPPNNSGVVRNQLLESPAPARTPEVKGASTVAEATPAPSPQATNRLIPRRVTPKPALPKAKPKQNLPILLPVKPSPSPSASPSPSPSPSSSPQPSGYADGTQSNPTPLPTPLVPNQGDVLGDSIGPDGSTPPDSSSSTEPLANAGPNIPLIP